MAGLINKILLFFIFLKIGAVSFGGSYSIWGMVEQEFVTDSVVARELGGTLSENQFYQFLEIGRMTPGPNINGVMLVGHHYQGVPGIFIVFVGLLLPSVLAIMALFHINRKWGVNKKFAWFKQGALSAAIGILIFFTIKMMGRAPQTHLSQILAFWGIAVFAFVLIHKQKANIILVTLFSGLITWSFQWLW